MINTDLTHNCPDELLLWIDNDKFLTTAWRRAIRTGDLSYVKDAFESFTYRDDQWEAVVTEFEFELKQNEDALVECNIVRDMHGNVVEGA